MLRFCPCAGNVLIPSDTAGRTLELALLLEHAWKTQRLSYAVVLLTPVAYSTLEFAKSQLEWMNQDISEAFNKTRTNPFELRYEPYSKLPHPTSGCKYIVTCKPCYII